MLFDYGGGEDSWKSLDCKETQPVNPKGSQSWIFTQRTYAEADAPILWPTDTNSQLIGNNPDTGKDWRQEEKGTAEDDMVEWHHQLNGHEFGQALGVGEEQGSQACCSLWDCRVGHSWATEQQEDTSSNSSLLSMEWLRGSLENYV